MNDFKLLGGFDDGRTDGQTNERTLVVVESLSRLKILDPMQLLENAPMFKNKTKIKEERTVNSKFQKD